MLRYHWHRLRRLPGTPNQIARGFGLGAAVSVTPLIGLHMWLAFMLAWVSRASLMASFLGTFVGSYMTMLPLLLLDYKIGHWILSVIGAPPAPLNPQVTFDHLLTYPKDFMLTLWDHPGTALPLIWPTLLGSLFLGVFVYVVSVLVIKDAVHRWRHHRNHLLAARRHERSKIHVKGATP